MSGRELIALAAAVCEWIVGSILLVLLLVFIASQTGINVAADRAKAEVCPKCGFAHDRRSCRARD